MLGKILRFSMLSACIANSVALYALGFEASMRASPLFLSAYHEEAGPSFIGDPREIWGDFDTFDADLDLGLGILDWLWIRMGGRGALIQSNFMYLGSAEASLTIGGSIYGFDAGLGFRVLSLEDLRIDLGASFSFLGGSKFFTDFTQGGSLVIPGTFGSYAFKMFGPDAWVRLFWRPEADLPLAFRFRANGSPRFENHSIVSGWSPEPKEEYAEGWRWGASLSAAWIVSESMDLEAGWSYERLYYRWGDLATHDLDIGFSGPFLGLGLAL